jgi:tetratricopeptide (TPR) repeat protein
MPAHAPDPTAVLSAARMLPQAWKNCREASADTAVTACKTLIDSGLAKGDELAEIQTLNGRALRDRHELDKALEALTASIALNPTPAAYSLRGTVYYDKGSWEQAISDYSEAIRLDATNGEAFNNRAWTYYRTGRSEKALTDADAAVRLLGKQSYVWDTRGHIHAALGNREAAISDFRAALAIDPNSADSQAGLSKLGVN